MSELLGGKGATDASHPICFARVDLSKCDPKRRQNGNMQDGDKGGGKFIRIFDVQGKPSGAEVNDICGLFLVSG